MKQRSVAIVADYLTQRPIGRVTAMKRVARDDYIVGIEDIRDGRTQLVRTPRDLQHWLDSFAAGECVRPVLGLCWRCERTHSDRDMDGEVFRSCIGCQAELVVAAFDDVG